MMKNERRFYYLPSFVGWVNVNHIVAVCVADNVIYLSNGKVIRNVPVSELNMIMELEQQQFFKEFK